MNMRKRKLLAITVAVSMIASSASFNTMAPACIPDDPMFSLEKQLKKDLGKRKNKKGYLV